MGSGGPTRPGDHELVIALQSAVFAAVGWLLADLSSGHASPVALALTFLLWLATLLAASRAVLALFFAVVRRRQEY